MVQLKRSTNHKLRYRLKNDGIMFGFGISNVILTTMSLSLATEEVNTSFSAI